MLQKPKCPVIALEEHYWDEELAAHAKGVERNPGITQRLFDMGELRLKEMDEAGIDIQVISHGTPSAQKLTGSDAAAIAAGANDGLAASVKAKPDCFAAFAALPTCDAIASANELERTVTKHGFKGAMVHGLTGGLFLDDKRFWPIFERAEKLDVPIYLHPSI